MTQLYPSQQDMQGLDKIERVIRDLYARLYNLEAKLKELEARIRSLQAS